MASAADVAEAPRARPVRSSAPGPECAPAVPATRDTFVLEAHTLRPGVLLKGTSRFDDDIWDLTPALHKLHDRAQRLHFASLPTRYQHAAKVLCHAVLSGPLPPGEKRPKLCTVRSMFSSLKDLSTWLDEHGGPPIAALTGDDLQAYQKHLLKKYPDTESVRSQRRRAVRYFWRFRASLGEEALSFDPFHLDDWGEPKATSTENATARIPEEAHGRLLTWALRFIDDFADDILVADTAWRASRQLLGAREWSLKHGRPIRKAVEELLAEHIAQGRPLPGHRGRANRLQIGVQLGTTASAIWFARGMLDEAAAIVGVEERTCMAVPITATVDGKPWLNGVTTYHLHDDSLFALARMLQTACYIVIAFLSGMRDSEVKHLRRGCLTVRGMPTATHTGGGSTASPSKAKTTRRAFPPPGSWVRPFPARSECWNGSSLHGSPSCSPGSTTAPAASSHR